MLKETMMSDSINFYIKESQNATSEQIRLRSSERAFLLAKKTEQDSLIYKALYNKIHYDIISQNKDSVNYYLKKLKNIYKQDSYQASYYFLKGLYFQNNNADSSFANYQKSQKLYSVSDEARAGYSLLMMAEIQRSAADYNSAEETLTKAYEYLKEENGYHGHIFNSFGLINWSLYNYDKALENYGEALKIAEDPQKRNIIQNNIAMIHRDKKDFNKSRQILDSLRKLPNLENDAVMNAKVLSNLGYVIYLSKNGNGLPYLKQAETIQDSIEDAFGKLSNYLNLSEVYLTENSTMSKKYSVKAYELAKKINNNDDKLKALEFLLKNTENKLDSNKIFSEYVALNDSIKKANQIAKNGFAKIKYDFTAAEKDALESKLLAEKTKGRNQLLLFAVVFLIVISVFVYRSMKKKNTIDKLKASYSAETRISRKVHDELANDVYNVMNFTNTQNISLPEKRERLMNDLDSLYKRTRDISKENSTIETGAQFAMQLKEMLSEYQNDFVNVASRGINDISWEKIESVKKIAIYRVLQELMVNMAKHSEATVSIISFKTKARNIEIDYFDNGIGIPSEKIIFRNGLVNAENRISVIGGRLIFESVPQKGLKIKIIFPV